MPFRPTFLLKMALYRGPKYKTLGRYMMNTTVAMVVMICRTSSHGLSNVYGKEIRPKIVNMDMRINRENSKYHRLTFLRELPSIVSAFRFRMVGCLTGCASYVPSSDCL